MNNKEVTMKNFLIIALCVIAGMATGLYLSQYLDHWLPGYGESQVNASHSMVVSVR